MSEHVLAEVDDRVAVVTLNRPEARNALSSAMLVDFARLMQLAEKHRKARLRLEREKRRSSMRTKKNQPNEHAHAPSCSRLASG